MNYTQNGYIHVQLNGEPLIRVGTITTAEYMALLGSSELVKWIKFHRAYNKEVVFIRSSRIWSITPINPKNYPSACFYIGNENTSTEVEA